MATAADGNPRSRRDLGRSLRDAVVHHVPAVRGRGATMRGPTPSLHGFRPRIAREHGRPLYLVERVVGGLALDHDRLALPADHHRYRLALETRDRDDARHSEKRRHVFLVVHLVEERFLVRPDAHGRAEEISGLDRHGSLLWRGSSPLILAHECSCGISARCQPRRRPWRRREGCSRSTASSPASWSTPTGASSFGRTSRSSSEGGTRASFGGSPCATPVTGSSFRSTSAASASTTKGFHVQAIEI